MAKLEKIEVSFISLVDKPANRKDIVFKCRDKFNQERVFKVNKLNDEGLVSGTVYAPNEKDTDGDWANKETIRKAAHDFMASGKNFNIDTEHSERPVGAAVVESHLNYDGAWEVTIQMDPASEPFQKVKKGEYKGLSMMALVQKSEGEPEASGPEADLAARVAELSEQVAKQAKSIEGFERGLKGISKSRQLAIDSDGKVSIGKSEDTADAVFSEFDFSKLN